MPHNHAVHLPYGVSIYFVLAIKPKICNLAAIVGPDIIYHTITHHMSCDDFAVHISVLLLKQNIC